MQFSLKHVLALVVVAALLFAAARPYYVSHVAERRFLSARSNAIANGMDPFSMDVNLSYFTGEHVSHVEDLSLRFGAEEHIRDTLQALTPSRNLSAIEFHDIELQAEWFADSKPLRSVKKLTLSYVTGLSTNISAQLTRVFPCVSVLDLSDSDVSETAFDEFLALPRLTELDVSDTELDGNACLRFGTTKKLDSLDLSHCKFAGELVLPKNSRGRIRKLNVSFTGIDTSDLNRLLNSLRPEVVMAICTDISNDDLLRMRAIYPRIDFGMLTPEDAKMIDPGMHVHGF